MFLTTANQRQLQYRPRKSHVPNRSIGLFDTTIAGVFLSMLSRNTNTAGALRDTKTRVTLARC